MSALSKNVIGHSSSDQAIFEERFKYFLASNKRNKLFSVKATGTFNFGSDEESGLPIDQESSESPFYDDLPWPSLVSEGPPWSEAAGIDPPARPANPLSSILSGQRSVYSTISSYSSSFSSSSFSSPDELDYEGDQEDNDLPPVQNYLSSPDHLLYPPPALSSGNRMPPLSKTASSSSSSGSSSNSLPTKLDDGTSSFRSESSGFFSGPMTISHDKVLNWALQQNCCDARLLNIQASLESPSSKTFPISSTTVNLIEPTGISVISDIDDTIKHTQIMHGARTVLANTFFNSSSPIHGMAEAYMNWYTQGASFHYVSNSPFQLLPFLQEFLNTHHFPPGSMHLRLDGSLLSRLIEIPGRAKRDAILSIMTDFPHRQFILVGDSGEIDLEIYTKIAQEHPGRILKIFIHDVTTPFLENKQKKKSLSPTSPSNPNSTFLSSLDTILDMGTDLLRSNSLASLFPTKPKRRPSMPHHSSSSSLLSSTTDETLLSGISGDLLTLSPSLSSPASSLYPSARSKLLSDLIDPTLSSSSSITSNSSSTLLNSLSSSKASLKPNASTLDDRRAKAQEQIPDVDIILFQDASSLKDDMAIQSTIWQHWDDQCS
ncbi:hypothetical protein DM01DRAFT_1331940 [Hesseltinella vesiculosa]|uniref:Phosphatidate phosphatase APP1 catalytic domain-containing protein n=1 Tax=Hesseltinella vesiculosa TaxID=101127 RepID=A0A1X2GTK5_9FUNG|nr:hypothetical protein DM01DRAFT_1331940 [Hesseltinella vesiculosa]